MTNGIDWMHFFYDCQNKLSMVSFNCAMYHYLYNLQEDVLELLDAFGNIVVEYNYDVWSKPLSTTGALSGALGYLNPFRYRSYVYDKSTELYYAASRYYNSKSNQFINAVDAAYLGADGDIISYTLCVCCENNPIKGYNPTV